MEYRMRFVLEDGSLIGGFVDRYQKVKSDNLPEAGGVFRAGLTEGVIVGVKEVMTVNDVCYKDVVVRFTNKQPLVVV